MGRTLNGRHGGARWLPDADRPRVVALGGGTGLPALLRGMREVLFRTDSPGGMTCGADHLTAIVSVADDGGSSGRLRREHGVLPPGDVRNCLVALSEGDPLLARLFEFRFAGNGATAGHNLGNLILTALSQIGTGFDEAVEQSGRILGIRGQVFPSSLDGLTLHADFTDGTTATGESRIALTGRRIRRVWLEPADARAVPKAVAAIEAADLVALGPGSLYTSLMPTLLIGDIANALARTRARVVLVGNLMTEPGETDGYTAVDHLEAVRRHTPGLTIHDLLVNTDPIDPDLLDAYEVRGAEPVIASRDARRYGRCRTVARPLLARGRKIRHDPDKLAYALLELGARQEEAAHV